MSKAQKGKKYLKLDGREQIKKSLQRMANMVINDELSPGKANTLCRILGLQLEILDDDLMKEFEQLSQQIEQLERDGEL